MTGTRRTLLLFGLLALGAAPGVAAVWTGRTSGEGAAGALSRLDLALAGGALALWIVLALLPRAPELPRVPVWLCALLATAPAFVAAWRLPTTVSNDEQATLLQAACFAEGRLAEPLLQPSCERVPGTQAFTGLCALHRRQVVEDPERGVRFAKYPPGAAAAFAPAVALGRPELATALLGLVDVLLVAAIARRLGLVDAGRPALLLVLTPFFLLVQTSFQSEVASAPAALGAYLALLAARDASAAGRARHAAGLALAVGLLAGLVFLARPLTGVVLAAALGLGLVTRPRLVALAVLGGLPPLAAFLAYDHALTGSAWITPYEVYARHFGPFRTDASGALEPIDVFGRGAFVPGALGQLGRWSTALVGVLGLCALGAFGLWRRRARDGGAALAFVMLGPIAYALHWYPGHWAYPGPLYAFEALGLATVGAWAWLEERPDRWSRSLPTAALVAGIALTTWHFRKIERHVALRAEPARLAAEIAEPRAGPPAVVLLPSDAESAKLYVPSRAPASPASLASSGRVLVRMLETPERTRAALRELGLGESPVFAFRPAAAGVPARLERLR